MWYLNTFVLLVVLGPSFQTSTPADDHYVAAVVEYRVNRSSVETNRDNYVVLIQQAAQQNADVIVFPEMTLGVGSTNVTVPIRGLLQEYPIPALRPDLYDDLLVALSQASRQNQIYVVINIRENMNCIQPLEGEECPERKQYYFNTNVVFDRNGAVIDRYRKINLFGEASHTPALKPDLGIFTTDFGVTFGHFICFDLMFQIPSTQLVQKYNVTDIIFPTMWFSEMPYLTAVTIQESYAYTMDVNFLAAGANTVGVGSAGSGIYSGKAGALAAIMPGSPTTKLLVSRVPKIPGKVTETPSGRITDSPANLDNLRLKQDPSITAHLTRPLVEGLQEFTIVDKEVSCRFRVNLSNRSNTKYQYRAAAFSGVRTHSGFASTGSRICAILACNGDTKDTCAIRFETYTENSTAIFEELTIVGSMPTSVIMPEFGADDFVVFPVSETVSIMPLEVPDFTYYKNVTGNVTVHTLSLDNVSAELHMFGLWGRLFTTDGEDPHPSVDDPSSSIVHILSRSLLMCILAMFAFNQY
ncbi:unnamed protein product [Arctia plantaginis]|uniref:CN hydrolase domain-containing protein n=1 Tax=Arctia plantaginis TaxID=874455 RepID=A0A8S0YMB0_ARCPL|nr:unnamed protein product [Arctia plantaginis]